jgi:hypothetical protein
MIKQINRKVCHATLPEKKAEPNICKGLKRTAFKFTVIGLAITIAAMLAACNAPADQVLPVELDNAEDQGADWPERIESSTLLGNSHGNLQHGGFASVDKGWIYYSNGADDFRLYKSRLDGSENIRLNDEETYMISVMGDWVYYMNFNWAARKLYRIKIDGTDSAVFIDECIDEYIVTDQYIYYLTNTEQECSQDKFPTSLNRISLESEERTLLHEAPLFQLNLDGDLLFYLERGLEAPDHIFVLSPESLDTINMEEPCEYLQAVDGWLYYLNFSQQRQLYRVRYDGRAQAAVGTMQPGVFIVEGDWIYFKNHGDQTNLYRALLDGSAQELLSDQCAGPFNIVGDWIYFFAADVSDRIYFGPTFHGEDFDPLMMKMHLNGSDLQKVSVSSGFGSATLRQDTAALEKTFAAAMIKAGDLPFADAWQEEISFYNGRYSITFTSSGGSKGPITITAYLMPAEEHSTMTVEDYFSYNYEEMLSDQSAVYTGLPLAYILFNDISVYDEKETEAGLVFLKNGLYEGGVIVKGKDLDYGYCEEEAIRLGSLIWERLAD